MRFYSLRHTQKAQGIIEYIVLVTAVVVVLITGVLVKNGIFVRGVNTVLGSPIKMIDRGDAMSFGCENAGCDNAAPCGLKYHDPCGNNCLGSYCSVAGQWCQEGPPYLSIACSAGSSSCGCDYY
jgi:hypothetical protein